MKQTNINFKKKKKTQGSKRWSLYLSGCENLNNCFKTGKKKMIKPGLILFCSNCNFI